jgi:replicative DNA helicase
MHEFISFIRKVFNKFVAVINSGLEHIEEKAYRRKYSRIKEKDPVSIKEAVEGAIKIAEDLYSTKSILREGIPTGFKDLDIMTGGIRKGALTVIAGRPSMGKTALALSIIEHAAVKNKVAGVVFSPAMSKESLAERMLCLVGRVDLHKVRTGFFPKSDWPKLLNASQELSGAPVLFDDTQAISPNEIKRKVRKLKIEQDIQFVVIDYLQCMGGLPVEWGNDRKMTVVTNALAELARDLNIAVIVLSQISRDAEERENHMPHLVDLHEYGDMINIVDTVFFIFREEYYFPTDDNAGQAQIIVAKQRYGPSGTVWVKFLSRCTKFTDHMKDDERDES